MCSTRRGLWSSSVGSAMEPSERSRRARLGPKRLRWTAFGRCRRLASSSGCLLWPALGGVFGCGDTVNAPSGRPVAVVQGLVVLGQPRQSLRVEWSQPADSVFPGGGSPVAPSEVHLSLMLPDQRSVPFMPAPGIPGRFDAETTVEAGALYRLFGAVAGVTVSAEARVPAALTILVPASDTLRISGATCIVTCSVTYHWFAAGAVAYDYSQYPVDGQASISRAVTRDTLGTLTLTRQADTTLLRVFAYDPNAAAFLLSGNPRSNVQGAFGFLGAASLTERVVILE